MKKAKEKEGGKYGGLKKSYSFIGKEKSLPLYRQKKNMEKQWSSSPIDCCLTIRIQKSAAAILTGTCGMRSHLIAHSSQGIYHADMSLQCDEPFGKKRSKKKKMCDGGDDKGTRRNYTR